MSNIAQMLPEDILDIIFAQPVLAKLPLVTTEADKHGVHTIEADADISGIRWAKQSGVLDRGLSQHFHPNYDFHNFLSVCRSWFSSAQRALYRSVAVGTNSQDHPDPRVYPRLLRTLRANPTLAYMVQDLSLWLSPDRHGSGYEILRRCARARNIRIYGLHGGMAARQGLREALSSLHLVESLIINRFGNPKLGLELEAEHDSFGQVYSSRELCKLASRWPKLHTLVMLDDIISDDRSDVAVNDQQPLSSGTSPADFSRLRKFCVHRCQPSSMFYRSVLLSPRPPALQVFRCWLNLQATDAYFSLLRQTLAVLAPSLQNLTLMWQENVPLESSLRIIDEATALHFDRLIELQSAARIIPPSSVAKFPNLKYLAYDTMDVGELNALYEVVEVHKTLRGLQFFTPITLTNGEPPDWMNPESEFLGQMPESWRIILALKSLCGERNVLFEHSFGLAIVQELEDSDDDTESSESDYDDYYNSDQYDDTESDEYCYDSLMDIGNDVYEFDSYEEDSDSGYDGDNDR